VEYLNGLSYIWMALFIMISAGLAKEYNLFAPAYAYIKNTFKSNRFVVVLLSAIGGVLPISGRVTVSAGLLDTVAPKDGPGRHKFGIVDYLATHHYYMWSPLEKTVILPIAAFGLTYSAWLYMIMPLMIVSLAFIFWYMWYQVKEEDVAIEPAQFKMIVVIRNVVPMFVAIAAYASGLNHVTTFGALALYYMQLTQQWDYKKIASYINWEVLIVVSASIILANVFKSYSGEFQSMIENTAADPSTLIGLITISSLGFISSFLMGSSGKFVAIAVLMSQLFGVEYFLWFFAIDYAAYLLSPTHKCVIVGNRYFGTPFGTYYKALGTWAGLLLLVAGLMTFL